MREAGKIFLRSSGDQKYSDINLFLQLDGRGKTKLAHHNKLKPCEGDKAPRWVLKAKWQISSRRGNRD